MDLKIIKKTYPMDFMVSVAQDTLIHALILNKIL